MESPSGPRLGKLSSSGLPKGRNPKHGPPQEPVRSQPGPENNNNKHSSVCDEPAEGKRKGRPKADVQELRSIPAHMIGEWKEEFKRRSRVKCPCSGCWLEFPSIYGVKYHYQRCQGATVAEKLSHGCPHCEAVFATKVRLQKHKLWNHPERGGGGLEPKDESARPVKSNAKKRPMENSPPSPMFFKVKKTHEASAPSHNGELAHRKPHSQQVQTQQVQVQTQTQTQTQQVQVQTQQVQLQSQQSHSTSSEAEASDSDGDSIPPAFPDEDPERTRHRRKQKTPKKFTGEQPSISGTFGLKGMTKVEEKLKAGRAKRSEVGGFSEEPQRRPPPSQTSKKDPAATSSGTDTQWQRAIHERGEVVCPTCSIVTRKTIQGLKKHMEICQKLQDALKCQQCHKQFRSKAGLNYHTMAEHSTKPSGSDGQTGDKLEERERLRRVLKQMGRIKCPSEGCSAHFSSLMGYQYHQTRCGREPSDEERPVFLCQHCGKPYHSKAGRDYHVRTEHPPAVATATATTAMTATATTTTTTTTNNNNKDAITDTNNNTGKERVSAEPPSLSRKEATQTDRKDWTASGQSREKDRDSRDKDKDRERVKDRAPVPVPVAAPSHSDDFERTPSGRVRRRSAQVAVFHLQEIAEDELAKDWGTKRRIKDDLVPDSKRLNYTRPGLPNFSQEMLEMWKNQVKEKGFICCTNENCEAVYSSVSGLKAHLANCSQGGGEMGKYTCLICQKEFSSESGVKYHISKTHSQNWFRTATASQVASSSTKSRPPEDEGIRAEVRNGATTTTNTASTASTNTATNTTATSGKKRGRKPKERQDAPLQTQTEAPPTTQNSTAAAPSPSRSPDLIPDLIPDPTDSPNRPPGPNRRK